MRVDGCCLCGYIKYIAEVDVETTSICHCSDCQVNSGTAFGFVVGVMDNQFELQTGKLSIYIKIAESGSKRELGFCGKCGTRIFARPLKGEAGFFGLRAGTALQRNLLKPRRQAWKRSALEWTSKIETGLNYEKNPN